MSIRDSEPVDAPYTGDINYCSICQTELMTDDPRDQSKLIDGLGYACLSCLLKEEESKALQTIKEGI